MQTKTKFLTRAGLSVVALFTALSAIAPAAEAATHHRHRYVHHRVHHFIHRTSSSGVALAGLPAGVRYDAAVHPLASLHASEQQKFDAVLKVAKSKLGTPYIWGHNEDRGQYGFDCSNFTSYVYHHALGYRMSGSSKTQATSVGKSVPVRDMRPGDLLIFGNGRHVGIYIGSGEMIQEGGGLKRVGYLKVRPGSYWYGQLTAVKRMF